MQHAIINIPAGVAILRDLEAEDIEQIVRFWYGSGEDFLVYLGIDKVRLGTPEDTRQRFIRAIRSADRDQPSVAFAVTVNGEFAGYTLLNRYSADVNYSHWHITQPQLRGLGLSTALYPSRIKTYFSVASMNRLIHQPRTRNVAVNKMLDHWVPVTETCFVEKPDGVALPGEFNLRYVMRSDVARFVEKAALDGA